MSARRVAAAVLALGLWVASVEVASAKRVRVFAVGPKFELSWIDTRDDFRAKLFALTDRRERGRVAVPVQRGADDVASQLLGPTDPARPVETARDLITLPEDLGLLTALTGTRAVAARQQATLADSIAAVLAGYADVAAYYQMRFPGLALRPFPPTRLLNVALTDTFARVGVEVFAELADRYDAYLEAGVNMVGEWRIVCVSKAAYEPPPGGAPCDEENAAKVEALRSPDEPARTYAYEAATDQAFNMALLFDPDGRLIAREKKAYPTPTEAPGQLDLRPGQVSGLQAIDTPVGTLGFVTSRDAFMPDVVQRLDQQHVELLVQPEFFVNDIVRTQGMWAPDTLKSSGFSALQRLPSINALVLPETTGNVFEFTADAQQHIALKPRSTRSGPRGALVGQEPELGFAQVQRWIVRDPEPGEDMAARRRRLGLAGEAASAGGGGTPCEDPLEPGPCRGGHVEGVIAQDVQVQVVRTRRAQRRRKRGATPFSVNRPIASSPNVQRNVSLAARGDRVWAVYEERVGARDLVHLVRSSNGGRTWTRPRRVVGRPRGDEWWPAIAAGPGDELWLAWQDSSSGTQRVYVSHSRDRGVRWSVPAAVDAGAGGGATKQWKPSIAATGRSSAFVAWVDERDEFAAERGLRQAGLYGARVTADGAGTATRLDGGAPAELARTQDHAWAPSVAARGQHVLVSWMDVRTYDWRIYARESSDGGATFGAERPLQDTPPIKTDPILPPENEALNADPVSVLARGGPMVAWTDFRKTADSARRPHQLYDTMLAAPGGPNVQVDPHGRAQVSTFFPAAIATGDDVLVAWQDMRAGPADIWLARVRSGRTPADPVRVDDSGTRGWNQWRPRLAPLRRGGVLAAWEDERDGPANVFAARARVAALP